MCCSQSGQVRESGWVGGVEAGGPEGGEDCWGEEGGGQRCVRHCALGVGAWW